MAEMLAMMGTSAPAAAGTAATGVGASMIPGGTAGMFGTAAAPASAMTQSLMTPAAATPFVTEAAATSAMGSDPMALARFLSPETFGMGAPPKAGMDYAQMARNSLKSLTEQMESGNKVSAGGMSGRPPGYDPREPMEQQFARIMGWLQEGGR